MTKRVEETGLYYKIINHLKKRMLFADELAPPPTCSIGCHIANLHQRNEPFSFVDGDPEDLGLNLTFVGPSGHSKSYAQKQFLNVKNGLLPKEIEHSFKGTITLPGFAGTFKDGEKKYGVAKKYDEGIVGWNEITNLFLASQQEHSSELLNIVMEALTEREIHRDLGDGYIGYPTWITIWGGVQPKRFDLSQGLQRRFTHVSREWTYKDLALLKDRRLRRERHRRWDVGEVEEIREEIRTAIIKCQPVDIKWEGKILQFIHEKTDSHMDMEPLEKLILGKEVLEQYDQDVIYIRDNKENRQLIEMADKMQEMVAEGSDIALMINTLNTMENPVSTTELYNRFKGWSYNLSGFMSLVDTCQRLRVIKVTVKEGTQWITLRMHRKKR